MPRKSLISRFSRAVVMSVFVGLSILLTTGSVTFGCALRVVLLLYCCCESEDW